jgi:hypothetical protein
MGGMMVFPGNTIDGKQTINGAKGFHPRIRDRLDLTAECIRQHYLEGSSPLAGALSRYGDFFALVEDFGGYVDFFLLQDLVSDDLSSVRFFMPNPSFRASPLPHLGFVSGLPPERDCVRRGAEPPNDGLRSQSLTFRVDLHVGCGAIPRRVFWKRNRGGGGTFDP